jgi:aryl-alcohol dehydrogenase-like predicted oxidoreductase
LSILIIIIHNHDDDDDALSISGDYSILDRKSDENGVAEAASSINENVGFMAYNVLAGGFLTDKYVDAPVPYDNPSLMSSLGQRKESRGRHDFDGWGRTLYRYRSDPAKESIKYYREIAKDNKMSLLELSLRWTRERSLVTSSLLGISNMKQFDEDMSFYQKDALSDDVMWQIDRIHMRHRNPIFSSTRVGRDWNGEGEIGEVIP